MQEILKLIDYIYSVFGFEYSIELSTRPDDYLGELDLWNEAEQSLAHVLDDLGLDYSINEGTEPSMVLRLMCILKTY